MHGLYIHSHWQGSGPDRLVAVGSRAVVDHAASKLDSCSMCGPGRGGYSVGTCYVTRRVGYARASAPTLPDAAISWDASDLSEWLADAEVG